MDGHDATTVSIQPSMDSNDGSDFSIIPTMNSVRNGPTPVFPERVRDRAEVEMY